MLYAVVKKVPEHLPDEFVGKYDALASGIVYPDPGEVRDLVLKHGIKGDCPERGGVSPGLADLF